MRPKLHSGILNPRQVIFLQQFFASSIGPRFFLTGGTALAGFYFGHRLSEDLDLFTVADDVLVAADPLVSHIADNLGYTLVNKRETEFFRQFILEARKESGEALRVDLVSLSD